MLNPIRFLTQMRAAAALGFLTVPLVASQARAQGIESCGNIHVEASATCKVEVEGGCKAKCTPVSFEAACAGECTAECPQLPSVSCTGSCEASCNGECDVDPGSIECQGSCEADCEGSCEGRCATAENETECRGACRGTCKAECSASCEGTPPSATCEAKCKAKCEGQCTVDRNFQCNVDCHGACTARLQGGCEVQCEEPEGALFCDGQYVDHGNNAEECFEAIEDWISKNIDVSARGSASGGCESGVCSGQAEGEASCKCSAPGRRASGNAIYGAAGLTGLLAIAAMARRKRQ